MHSHELTVGRTFDHGEDFFPTSPRSARPVSPLAYDPGRGESPHIHTSLGEKARSAVGHTSHLLVARVQFLVEMLVVEVLAPTMTRPRNPDLYDVPLLTFGQTTEGG